MLDDPPVPNDPEAISLFLDFDGTLVELADKPDLIEVPADLPALLARVANRLSGRLAIVSGRSIADVETHLDCAALTVSGSHGLELRFADCAEQRGDPDNGMDDDVRAEIVRRAEAFPALHVEHKTLGVGLHYRDDPSLKSDVEALADELAGRHGLTVKKGNHVVELMPRACDKGRAVDAIMAKGSFAGTRPVFIGDDLTDEDGIVAASRHGGYGVIVGDRMPTDARYRLDGPSDVHRWLENLVEGE
ncbi:trehalose-phosphatase [uncultured Parasphingopyxis sp.]|uniref:trehalose-phosphatase n=1 Tax=uncultured Parasphingopyxis sp. TaxID=1547918 RepID=UPI002609E511|nr:trehalose-phosphatase [uncultured Parasphingopyxis sp.]